MSIMGQQAGQTGFRLCLMSKFLRSPLVVSGLIDSVLESTPAAGGPLSFVDSATSTASTIDITGLAQSGDLIVFFDRAADTGGAPAQNDPSGFTSIYSASSTSPGHRLSASYKISDGTETVLTGMNGNLGPQKIVLIFRGTSTISVATPSDVAAESTNGNPTGQTCNASGGTEPLIVCAFYCSGGSVDPRTFTPTEDDEVNVSTFSFAKYKIYNTSAADVSVDMDDEGVANGLGSFYINVTLS